jgi:hypothetical protein
VIITSLSVEISSLRYTKQELTKLIITRVRQVLQEGGPVTKVVLLPRWSCYCGGPVTAVVLLLR